MAGSVKRSLWAAVGAALADAEEAYCAEHRKNGRDGEELLAGVHTTDVSLGLSRGYASTISITFHHDAVRGNKVYFYALRRTHADTYSVWPAHSDSSL